MLLFYIIYFCIACRTSICKRIYNTEKTCGQHRQMWQLCADNIVRSSFEQSYQLNLCMVQSLIELKILISDLKLTTSL